jgi:hypothetical protein
MDELDEGTAARADLQAMILARRNIQSPVTNDDDDGDAPEVDAKGEKEEETAQSNQVPESGEDQVSLFLWLARTICSRLQEHRDDSSEVDAKGEKEEETAQSNQEPESGEDQVSLFLSLARTICSRLQEHREKLDQIVVDY